MTAAARWATADEAADLALLLRDIAVHYRQPVLAPDRYAEVSARWLALPERHFAIARVGGAVAGLASVSTAFPGYDLVGLLFLKELFVELLG